MQTCHIFPNHAKTWQHVYPGDMVISPKVTAWQIESFESRNDAYALPRLTMGHRPLFVIAVLSSGDLCSSLLDDEMLFIVNSRHGILCIVMLKV